MSKFEQCGQSARSPRSACGFTLIECLMASAVVVIAGLGVAASIAQGAGITDRSRDEARAWNTIREMHSRLTADNFSTLASNFHGKGFSVPGLPAVDGDSDGFPGSIVMSDVPGVPSCYSVTIRVQWQRSRRTYSVRRQFYVGNVYDERQAPPSLASLDALKEVS